eukprot:scaffold110385_cov35-Phaeocystis_antarctica.AAC.1
MDGQPGQAAAERAAQRRRPNGGARPEGYTFDSSFRRSSPGRVDVASQHPGRRGAAAAPSHRGARSFALTAYGLIILCAAIVAATLSAPCHVISIATPLASPRMAPAAVRKPTLRTVRMRTSPATGAPALVKYGSSPAIGGAWVAKYFSSFLRPSSALRPAPASTALLASACTAQRRSSPVGRLCCAGCQSFGPSSTGSPVKTTESDLAFRATGRLPSRTPLSQSASALCLTAHAARHASWSRDDAAAQASTAARRSCTGSSRRGARATASRRRWCAWCTTSTWRTPRSSARPSPATCSRSSWAKSIDPLLRHEVEGVHRLGSLGYQTGPSEPQLTTADGLYVHKVVNVLNTPVRESRCGRTPRTSSADSAEAWLQKGRRGLAEGNRVV